MKRYLDHLYFFNNNLTILIFPLLHAIIKDVRPQLFLIFGSALYLSSNFTNSISLFIQAYIKGV